MSSERASLSWLSSCCRSGGTSALKYHLYVYAMLGVHNSNNKRGNMKLIYAATFGAGEDEERSQQLDSFCYENRFN